jgi:hypothetical protein
MEEINLPVQGGHIDFQELADPLKRNLVHQELEEPLVHVGRFLAENRAGFYTERLSARFALVSFGFPGRGYAVVPKSLWVCIEMSIGITATCCMLGGVILWLEVFRDTFQLLIDRFVALQRHLGFA